MEQVEQSNWNGTVQVERGTDGMKQVQRNAMGGRKRDERMEQN